MTKQSKWTPQEEEYLKVLKQEKNISDWRKISKELGAKFPNSKRRSKQCRERYMNYTRFQGFSASSLDWTDEEEMIIFQKYFEHGSSWKLISINLVKRSQNCIKNKFYSGIRKFIRKFNSVPSQSYKIRFQTIKRMLRATDPTNNSTQNNQEKFKELRHEILKFSQLTSTPLNLENVKQVKNMLIQFNKDMRYLCLKKKVVSSQKNTLKVKKQKGSGQKITKKEQICLKIEENSEKLNQSYEEELLNNNSVKLEKKVQNQHQIAQSFQPRKSQSIKIEQSQNLNIPQFHFQTRYPYHLFPNFQFFNPPQFLPFPRYNYPFI